MRAVVYDRCARVTEFAVGDRVFGMRTGANADYVRVHEAVSVLGARRPLLG